jgi:hypothetical protein
MKALLDLLPIGLGVAIAAVVTWFLLDRNWALGKWLLAALMLFHGWVHVMFVFPQPEGASATEGGLAWPFDMSGSWLIGGAVLDGGLVRTLGIGLILIVVGTFVLAALSTMGWLVPAGWWSGLVIGGAAASTLMLVTFFSPALLLGFAINGALTWLVLASVWSPLVARLPGGGLAS